MQNKKLQMLLVNLLWVIITIVCVIITHETTMNSYFQVGRNSGKIEARYEIFELIKKTGAADCHVVRTNEWKHLLEVKALAIDFAHKNPNVYELCLWE